MRISIASSSVFSAGRVRRPGVVAEIVVHRARGEDQIVVGGARAVVQAHRALGDVDARTSAISTVVLRWPPRMWRMGAAIAGAESPAVATW